MGTRTQPAVRDVQTPLVATELVADATDSVNLSVHAMSLVGEPPLHPSGDLPGQAGQALIEGPNTFDEQVGACRWGLG